MPEVAIAGPPWIGVVLVAVFSTAYLLVALEERIRLRKSVVIILAAGLMWSVLGGASMASGGRGVGPLLRDHFADFAELFLFLLSAVTYVNTLEERQVFDVLRCSIMRRRLAYRSVFWLTGALAFGLSPFLDNLTTALVIGSIALSVGRRNPAFCAMACVNVVVAANAGGAFSPFGDITTLMVWQQGKVSFGGFVALFAPALVSWLIPALIMSTYIAKERPDDSSEQARLKPGARGVIALFAVTVAGTVAGHQWLGLPPAAGMMTGLGLLKLYSYLLTRARRAVASDCPDEVLAGFAATADPGDTFDIFEIMRRTEYDTLLFFYGVIMCVGALGAVGVLHSASVALYSGLGRFWAAGAIGGISAVVDNIPVMFAVLKMDPHMGLSGWLLVTLTAGIGGSLLSVGSAAGLALMGQAPGVYTFRSHLRWSWAILLGCLAAMLVHLLVSGQP